MSAVAEPLRAEDQKERLDPKTKLELEVLEVRKELRTITVTDQASYESAAGYLVRCATVRKQIEEYWRPLKASAHKAHSDLCSAESKMIAEMAGDEKSLRTATSNWEIDQERIVLERRRAAEEAARLEQLRLQQLADEENARLRAEAQRQADDERLAMAAQIQEHGGTEAEIEEVLSAPVAIPEPAYVAPMVPIAEPVPQFQRAVGLTAARKNWKAEVTDIVKLAAYVVANPDMKGLLQGNEAALNAQAKSLEAGLRIPGVRAFNAPSSVGVRSGR